MRSLARSRVCSARKIEPWTCSSADSGFEIQSCNCFEAQIPGGMDAPRARRRSLMVVARDKACCGLKVLQARYCITLSGTKGNDVIMDGLGRNGVDSGPVQCVSRLLPHTDLG